MQGMAGKRSGAAPTAKKKGKAIAAQRKAAAGPTAKRGKKPVEAVTSEAASLASEVSAT